MSPCHTAGKSVIICTNKLFVHMKGHEVLMGSLVTKKSKIDWMHSGSKSLAQVPDGTLIMGHGEQEDDTHPSPLDAFLSSLGGCIIAFIIPLAKKKRMIINDVQILVEGDVDTAGWSRKNSGIRAGFQEIRFQVIVDSPEPEEKIRQVVEQALEYCPVKDSLVQGVSIVEIRN